MSVTAAAKLIHKKHGGAYKLALDVAKSTAEAMPGKPPAKAIFSEAEYLIRRHKDGKPTHELGSGERFKEQVAAIIHGWQERGDDVSDRKEAEKRASAIAAKQMRDAYTSAYVQYLSQRGQQAAKKSKKKTTPADVKPKSDSDHLVLKMADEKPRRVSIDDFLRDNESLDRKEVRSIRNLELGASYSGGGGAAPAWSVTRVMRYGNPLESGCSRESASDNISELRKKGWPQKQAVAIALEHQRRAGCDVPRKANPVDVLDREFKRGPRGWQVNEQVRVECDAKGYCVVVEPPGGGRRVMRAANPVDAAKRAKTISLVVSGYVDPNAPKTPDRQGKRRANPVDPACKKMPRKRVQLVALQRIADQDEEGPVLSDASHDDMLALIQAGLITQGPASLPRAERWRLTDQGRACLEAYIAKELEIDGSPISSSWVAVGQRLASTLRGKWGFSQDMKTLTGALPTEQALHELDLKPAFTRKALTQDWANPAAETALENLTLRTRAQWVAEAAKIAQRLSWNPWKPGRRKGNPVDVDVDDDDDEVDADTMAQVEAARDALSRAFGRPMGGNADWMDSAWFVQGSGERGPRMDVESVRHAGLYAKTSVWVVEQPEDSAYCVYRREVDHDAGDTEDEEIMCAPASDIQDVIDAARKYAREVFGRKGNPATRAQNPRTKTQVDEFVAARTKKWSKADKAALAQINEYVAEYRARVGLRAETPRLVVQWTPEPHTNLHLVVTERTGHRVAGFSSYDHASSAASWAMERGDRMGNPTRRSSGKESTGPLVVQALGRTRFHVDDGSEEGTTIERNAYAVVDTDSGMQMAACVTSKKDAAELMRWLHRHTDAVLVRKIGAPTETRALFHVVAAASEIDPSDLAAASELHSKISYAWRYANGRAFAQADAVLAPYATEIDRLYRRYVKPVDARLENPSKRATLKHLRDVAQKSCGAVRPVREKTRKEFWTTVEHARHLRDTQRAKAANACRGAREDVRAVKGPKPRVSAAEKAAESAQVRDAQMRDELRDPADWATWVKTGGGRAWKGPRWREQFLEFLHDEGNAKYDNIEVPSDEEYARMERAHYALDNRSGARVA